MSKSESTWKQKPHDIGRNKAKREARAKGHRHIGKEPRFYRDNGKQNSVFPITHGGQTWLAIDNTGQGYRECRRRLGRLPLHTYGITFGQV